MAITTPLVVMTESVSHKSHQSIVSTHVDGPQNALNGRLEEPGVSWIQAPKSVVVHHHAAKTAVLRQRARLWPDGLSGEDTADRGELRVPVHQLDVASQLLHGVQASNPLNLNGPMSVGG